MVCFVFLVSFILLRRVCMVCSDWVWFGFGLLCPGLSCFVLLCLVVLCVGSFCFVLVCLVLFWARSACLGSSCSVVFCSALFGPGCSVFGLLIWGCVVCRCVCLSRLVLFCFVWLVWFGLSGLWSFACLFECLFILFCRALLCCVLTVCVCLPACLVSSGLALGWLVLFCCALSCLVLVWLVPPGLCCFVLCVLHCFVFGLFCRVCLGLFTFVARCFVLLCLVCLELPCFVWCCLFACLLASLFARWFCLVLFCFVRCVYVGSVGCLSSFVVFWIGLRSLRFVVFCCCVLV